MSRHRRRLSPRLRRIIFDPDAAPLRREPARPRREPYPLVKEPTPPRLARTQPFTKRAPKGQVKSSPRFTTNGRAVASGPIIPPVRLGEPSTHRLARASVAGAGETVRVTERTFSRPRNQYPAP